MLRMTNPPRAGLPLSTCCRRGKPALPHTRSTTACKAAHNQPTPQQVLRGHGQGGWKDAGYDLKSGAVDHQLRDLILTYGELAQATYDRLGLDPCTSAGATYGATVVEPAAMLTYLDQDYPTAPDAQKSGRAATGNLYHLPAKDGMSPLLYALPGKAAPAVGQGGSKTPGATRKSWVIGIVDYLFTTTTQVLANLVDSGNGGRTLFKEVSKDGRRKVGRGAFFGYVAVSEPSEAGEVDVALVWRGTIFKEEWESNFVQNELDRWTDDADGRAEALCKGGDPGSSTLREPVTPDPAEVGVHDGFQDLYDRPIDQAWPRPKTSDPVSPRQAVHAWLAHLLDQHNVTTITTTGHSLGGGLSTVCAYDVACWLKQQWADGKTFAATKTMPKVTCISFAAPRVGNATFGEQFKQMGVKALRVVNKGDLVPLVPGFLVQIWTSVLGGVSDKAPWLVAPEDLLDMESRPISLVRNLSKWYSILCARLNKDWRSRWGYWHVGQVLELDLAAAGSGLLQEEVGAAQKHNLELYLYLASLASSDGSTTPGTTNRNPLLMNKADDLLANKAIPANWWGPSDKRGCTLVKGRWVPPVTAGSDPSP